MKKLTLTILITMIGINMFAQDANVSPEKETRKSKKVRVRPGRCPAIYITTSTGINNNTAILGFSFDVPVSKNVSIDAGPGTGTWGNKVYVGAKYYLKPCHRGFAFGTGLTYCPGVNHDHANLTTVYGNTEDVGYNKNPQTNILFAAYKYWYLGKKYNRVYVELGWSAPLSSGEKITQLYGDPISSDTRSSLDSDAPGGPILAVGVSFGVY
jgi:hypothetical protein